MVLVDTVEELDYRDPEWVSEQLGLDKNTVYKYLQDGVIPAVQLGRKWLISESNLRAWLVNETSRQTTARRQAADLANSSVARLRTFSPATRDAIRRAHAEARACGHEQLGQGHLLLAVIEEGKTSAARALSSLGMSADALREAFVAKQPVTDRVPPKRLGRTDAAREAMHQAAVLVQERGDDLVSLEEVVLAIAGLGHGVGWELLSEMKISDGKFREALEKIGK